MSKRILLTGATGFIGQHLLRKLQEDERASVTVLGRTPPQQLRAQDSFLQTNLVDAFPATISKVISQPFDIIFHMAAFTPKNKQQAQQYVETVNGNVVATARLLDAIQRPVCRFVLASTLDVYDISDSAIVTEETHTQPATAYGIAKFCAERLVENHAKAYGYAATVLRIGHIYGPGEEAYQKLIPQTIRTVANREAPSLYGTGNALRDFLYVGDAVDAIISAANSPQAAGQTINIVSGVSVTIRETVEEIIRVSGKAVQIKNVDAPDGVSFRFDNSKMKRITGVIPKLTLSEGLRREYTYFESLK
jgi:nucleoside-diphosphate-sugar epimerase